MKEPKIRFKGFQGEWVEKALKEVAPLQRGFDLPSHSICTGLIPIAYSNGVLNYHNIGKCYAPGLVTGRSGTIGKFTFIESGMYWPHNTSLWVTNFFNNVPKYIYYMYHTIGIEKYSTGSGVPTLNRNDVHDIIIYCPSIAEQQSIADYFTNLDTLIQSTTKKIESLKQVKAASLQSMFPQEGETTPRVRFKGFEGEWEKATIKDVATFLKGRGYSKSDLRVKGTPIILYGRMYTKYETCITNVDTYVNPLPSSIYTLGNEVVMPASGETPEDISCASAVKARGIILGGDLNILRFDTDYYDTTFFALSLSNGKAKKDLSNMAQGKSVVHLHNSDIEKVDMLIPSFAEQRAIASYFTNLDSQISLQNQRLEKLKQIKSACLDNMFV